MSSVLIKGMDIPRNCRECDWCYGTLSDGVRCERLEKWLEIDVETKRDSDCPIVEVRTPHGRLIDADALPRRDINLANVPYNWIEVAPTIIEAENN